MSMRASRPESNHASHSALMPGAPNSTSLSKEEVPAAILDRSRKERRESRAASTLDVTNHFADPSGDNKSVTGSSSNAISTLLQPPIVHTGLVPSTVISTGHKIPTSRDIPPVTLTNIPHVEPTVFAPYLQQAGSLYEAFQRAKEGDGENAHLKRPRGSSKSDHLSGLLGYGGSPSGRLQADRTTSGGQVRRRPLQVDPISTVPEVYSESDFHLENPRTFDIVSERAEIVQPQGPDGVPMPAGSSGRKALAQNAILQEKLSWFMDIVEVHLISSISAASTSFFAALGSLRDLHIEAAESVAKIKTLRQDLVDLDQQMAFGGLKIVAMRRRRENMKKLGLAVQQLRGITESIAWCEDQVEKGQIEEALEGLTGVERLIAGERRAQADPMTHGQEADSLIDLRSVKALEGVGDTIAYLRQRVGKSFEMRFLEVLLSDLRRHVDAVAADDTFERWDNASRRSRGTHIKAKSSYPAYMQSDEHLRTALQVNLRGLAASQSIKSATAAYREAVWREIKSLIRRHLPSSSDDDLESTISASTQSGRRMTQQEKSSILARNLRDLDVFDAEEMLRKIYSNVGEALRRLGTQVKVVLDITSSLNEPPERAVGSTFSSPVPTKANHFESVPVEASTIAMAQQADIQQTLDMSNLLGQAVDIAQAQITKILKVRSDQSIHLALPPFLRYFHLNRLFADECEAVSGRGGTALKNVVNAQIKDFVQHAAERERQALIQSMDSDHWEAATFTDSSNEELEFVIEASTRDPARWSKLSEIWSDHMEDPKSEHSTKSENGVNGESLEKKIRSAMIDEQKFILPLSALTLLSGVGQHEKLITGIPSMTIDITASLLEYLKLFNSRSSQLILGAGATRSAGLKNITTKHLALASQALSFVTALTPYIREFVRRRSPGAGALMTDFDKVKRLYQEHQSGINDKLVDIMSGRATTHVNAMKKIDWDAAGDSSGVNPYMETLIKETITLHKVLSKHLPPTMVRSIIEPVFASYREQWGNAFAVAGVRTRVGKERMLRDVEQFQVKLSKLDGSGDTADHVVSIVNSKAIADQSKPETRLDGQDMSMNEESKASDRPSSEAKT